MMARSIATAVAIALAALSLAIIATSSSSSASLFASAAPLSSSRKLLENYWRRSSPGGFYPGDSQGWNELGWGPDGRYYYSLNGWKGYFSAGCFGCGRWTGGGPPSSGSSAAAASSGGGGASAAASSGPAFSGCGPCEAWGGSSCVRVPSSACSLSGIPDSCGVCTYWAQGQGCVSAAGCGTDFATGAFSSSSSSGSGGGGGSSSASSYSSSNGGNNAVYFSNGNGGNGVAVSSGPGAWAGPSGNNGVFASSGGGGAASSCAGPGGASAFAGK